MVLIFMGTPSFAVPSLKALLQTSHRIPAVLTQTDKPKGRGLKVESSPVSLLARCHGIRVLQPATLKDDQVVSELASLSPDLIVVVAYGKILPPAVLRIPRFGCINLHASLLPKYHGAAPIQWSLIRGEKTSGVTTMLMDEGMDTGPILSQEMVLIEPRDTAGSLAEKLAGRGAALLVKTLEDLETGGLRPIPQNNDEATYAPRLTREDGMLHWSENAVALCNRVRGLNPRPGALTFYRGQSLKILTCRSLANNKPGVPGEIIDLIPEGIVVKAGEDAVLILELQPPGRTFMSASAYLRGHPLTVGERFQDHA